MLFELIRVAIGKLYNASKKKSLVGVCFAALQRLGADADEGFAC